MSLNKLRDIVEDRGPWRAVVHWVAKSGTRLSDWTTTTATYIVTAGWRGCYLFQLIGEQKESERSKVCLDSKPRSYTLCFSYIIIGSHMGSLQAPLISHVWLLVTPWTAAHQAPLSSGFSRQEYRSGLPFPPPGHLPNPKNQMHISWVTCIAGGFFSTEPSGKPRNCVFQKS